MRQQSQLRQATRDFGIDIRKKYFTVRLVKQGNRLQKPLCCKNAMVKKKLPYSGSGGQWELLVVADHWFPIIDE